MQTSLLKREYIKIKRHWPTYLIIVCLFSFFPATVDFLYKMYYPFDVSDANIQPFPVIEDVVEPGGVVTYQVDVTKHYPFPGTVNRYLFSEKCDIFEPLQPPIESNRNVGRLQSHTTVAIPDKITPCPYVLIIDVIYHPNQWRALPVISYKTDEFIVTNKKKEIDAIKEQVDSLEDFIEDKVIEEPLSEEQKKIEEETSKGAAF